MHGASQEVVAIPKIVFGLIEGPEVFQAARCPARHDSLLAWYPVLSRGLLLCIDLSIILPESCSNPDGWPLLATNADVECQYREEPRHEKHSQDCELPDFASIQHHSLNTPRSAKLPPNMGRIFLKDTDGRIMNGQNHQNRKESYDSAIARITSQAQTSAPAQ
jgi:hypothetical protein